MKFIMVNFFNFKFVSLFTEELAFRKRSHDLIIKFSENLYRQLEKENRLDTFKNDIVTKIENKAENFKKKNQIENINEVNLVPIKEEFNQDIQHKLKFSNSSLVLRSGNSHYRNRTHSGFTYESFMNSNAGDFISNERTVKFYISLLNDCNVLINDTVSYQEFNNSIDSTEDLILSNNVDFIDPKGVFSNDVDIDLFVYNKKLNMYTVFFNNSKQKTKYKIEYDYTAVNIIKTQNSNNNSLNNNTFLWKFYNENLLRTKQKLNVEIYFSIDKLFENENVSFNSNKPGVEFNKTIVKKKNKRLVKYKWSGFLGDNEVLVLETKFPMYFENCNALNIDVSMIIVGSFFILFLILVLYIILSQIIKFED